MTDRAYALSLVAACVGACLLMLSGGYFLALLGLPFL